MIKPEFTSVPEQPAGEFEKIRNGLLELCKLKAAEKEKDILYEEMVNELPDEMRKSVLENIDRFRGYGLSDEQLREEVRIRVEEIKSSYIDKRFDSPNQSYMRLEIEKRIDQVVSEDPREDETNGIGMLSFDVNGLKAVNDIAGHSAGNEYLKRIAKIFKSGEITKKMLSQNIEVFFASSGGDEFSILLSGKQNLSDTTGRPGEKIKLEEILSDYEKEIASLDCSDLVDMSRDGIKEKFAGISVPEDFKFHASASGGHSTFKEILADYLAHEQPGRGYREALLVLMGKMIDNSDKRGKQRKDEFKERMSSGTEQERFHRLLLYRNSEAMKLELENQKLKNKLAELGGRQK
jgi:GGDEF domain-containing protein